MASSDSEVVKGHVALAMALAMFVVGCGSDAGSADAGLDAPPALVDAARTRLDSTFGDVNLNDDGGCVEGAACAAGDGCTRGTMRCADHHCEPTPDSFVALGTSCGGDSACDGEGHCELCGDRGQPCCGTVCLDALMCGADGLCTTCSEGVGCRLEDPCHEGVQRCEGATSTCEDQGVRAASSDCSGGCDGEQCACSATGACEVCGVDGAPCCDGACADGAICNPETNVCFTCSAGEECAVTDVCALGLLTCGPPSSCLEVGRQPRGHACGTDRACDGANDCVACGALGEPCCDTTCDTGLACHPLTRSCFTCDVGAACVSANACRTGLTTCDAGEARCEENASVARGTSCGSGSACDGSGGCGACGGVGQPCCGSMCTGTALCDGVTATCVAECTAGMACASADGCRTGTRTCASGAATCTYDTQVARTTSCGPGRVCDGAGACAACGGAGQPCCGTACGDGLACNTLSGTCGGCPEGMVLIGGASFDMGAAAADTGAGSDERPVHRVAVSPFCIDAREVSVERYATCTSCSAGGTGTGCNGATAGSQPMNCVDWSQAQAFCASRSARLPTEAEWELAARGTSARLYPWGNEAASCERARYSGCGEGTVVPASLALGATPTGISDLGGNVAEWVADRYAADFYASANAPGDNPTGPTVGSTRVVRGGGFSSVAADLRSSSRDAATPDTRVSGIGFRCVLALP